MIFTQSLFHNHLLSPSLENGLLSLNIVENSIITLLICIILGLMSVLVVLHRKQIPLILQGLFSQRIISQLIREIKIINERIFPLLISVNILIQTLFLFALFSLFLPHFSSSISLTIRLLLPFFLIIADLICKRIIGHILLYLFDTMESKETFFLYKFLNYSTNSIFLFPILICFFYTQISWILLLYIPLFLTSFLALLYRLYTLTKKTVNKFHFFLYFCTIEVLPYFVFIKVLFFLEN